MGTKAKKQLLCILVTTKILRGCVKPKLSDSLYRYCEVGLAKQTERCRMQISSDARNRVLPVDGFATETQAPQTTKTIH